MAEKQKVLVVDDEQRNVRIVELSLQDKWDIRTAENGEKALEIAEAFRPDLVLLDIMMPGIDGYEVCRRLRGMPTMSHTKVILVSGKAMIEERLKGYEIGADDYITKPFVAEELAAKVSVFMRLTKAERELVTFNATLEEKVKQRTEQLFAAEAKLINAAKMSALGEMAGGIAHEINTPLTAIGMRAGQIAELLDENFEDKAMLKQMAKHIETTVDNIAKIIYGLLSFARQGDKQQLAANTVSGIIDDTLALCREKFKKSGIELKIKKDPDSQTVSCNAVQISQVLMNLLNNAHDALAGTANPWIGIDVQTTPDGLSLAVSDSGAPIEKMVREKMFQPFFTTKDIGKGTGLGLSLSKGLMESNGGTLTFDEGSKVTRFVMTFPKKGAV